MTESNKVTRVQLALYARNLKNVAGLGKGTSDPYAVVTLVSSDPAEKARVLGKTEVIKNSLSPQWTTTFLIDYEFGKPTRVNVGIFDEIRKAKNNKPMGSAVFEIGELLGSRGNIKAKNLKHGGTVFARVEKAKEEDAGTFTFALQGVKLRNIEGLLSKSDPFFEVSRRVSAAGGPTWQPVYRSKHIKNNLNPKWEPVTISMNQLCGGDPQEALNITVFDWEKSGRHRSMGSFETTVNGIIASKTNAGTGNVKSIDTTKAFRLLRRGKDFGMVVVTAAAIAGGIDAEAKTVPSKAPLALATTESTAEVPVSHALDQPQVVPMPPPSSAPLAPTAFPIPTPAAARPKFVDYITGGCEIQMTVAVDFTGSNGDPRRPGTLHYIHKDGQLNDYEKALTAVGSVVARYDSDQKFPVLGFGAKYGGVINHCFRLGRTEEASGIAGILEAYRSTFKTGLTMSGPTIFAEVINLAAAQARSKQAASKRIGQQAYTILLILTDGAVSDIHGTKRAIQDASDAPLSIVIVGIGDADFSAMQFLDDFQNQEGSGRDICQFVQFSLHKSNKISLTKATLDEIPDQLVDYFYEREIMPLPAITGSKVDVVAEDFNEDVDVDLSIDINDEGEICLADSEDCVYDETSYGSYAMYAGMPAVPPPPTTSTQMHASAPHFDSSSLPVRPGIVPQQSQPAMQSQPFNTTYQPSAPTQPELQHGRPYIPGGQNAVLGSPVVAQPVFHVQVPAGVTEGMQLQVQNPTTGQPMIVTIPRGVQPGGTFPVAY